MDISDRRRQLGNDAEFVDDCLFGHNGYDAQQACEQVVNRLNRGQPWDHGRMADQIIQLLRTSEPPFTDHATGFLSERTVTRAHGHPGTAPSSTGETVTLGAAVEFTSAFREELDSAASHLESMALESGHVAEWSARSASSRETALATLTQAEVAGESVRGIAAALEQAHVAAGAMQQASEALLGSYEQVTTAADALTGAHRALTRQQTVAEAYAANPDAGSKQFNTLG